VRVVKRQESDIDDIQGFDGNEKEAATARLPPIIIGALALLLVLLVVGLVVVNAPRTADPTDRMGPKRNYARLPEMTFAISGGGRALDLKVLVELDPTVDPHIADGYATRISDRLGDRLRELTPEQLGGSEGAKLMKSTVASVVDRELRPVHVRDVLLESMVFK
jgi:flagellar basal body-associated protein FliL